VLLEIEVCEIRGRCPVYSVGDRIVVDDVQCIDRSKKKRRALAFEDFID